MIIFSRCFRSARLFILVAVLLCSFSKEAFAARKSGFAEIATMTGTFAVAIASAVYLLADEIPSSVPLDYNRLLPKLYVKYERQEVAASPHENISDSVDDAARLNLDDQYLATEGSPDAVILPIRLKPVPALPELFVRRDQQDLMPNGIIAAGRPDHWGAYLSKKLFWKVMSAFVVLEQDFRRARRLLSVCLDFTDAHPHIYGSCLKTVLRDLETSSARGAGLNDISNRGGMRMRKYSETGKQVLLPVILMFEGVVKIEWRSFDVIPAEFNGDFELVQAR